MQLDASLSWLALGLTYELLSPDVPVHIDDIVELSVLNSSEVLATLFTLEMKGIVRQLPGKTVQQSLVVEADRGLQR
jgi:predicted Rossmann fold nucleotide-binding protein DprA/Smf involved in DNA uptake